MKTMKTRKPNSANSSSSSSTILRQATLFKKARELSVLCAIELCVICYGADGTLKTYPEEREKVEAIALRYAALSKTKRRKKSVDLNEFLAKSNKKKLVRPRRVSKFPVWDPRFDNYSGEQVTGVVQSLERNVTRLQDRFRALVEVQEQRKMNQGASSSSTRNTINQYLLPQQPNNQFSMFLLNHENGNVSQIPLGLMNQGQSLPMIPPVLLGNDNSGSLEAFGHPLYDLSQPLFS
ncbi:PREDICTED: agamous-like MADS-box protein AGL103 [Camelina sativa]|uniref:Agamous-like MADS-box protein AGL103 n=1 Tax=Camelina sativa TaxID=90675 RepID=A0ABM0T0S1_CAMSA|nr:PREDICTED: agamous-like MADS-box protein AGL103 [Camelina sativa]